jgi:hypothetical protein
MAAAVETPRAATPWSLWVVGVVSLLWNAFGAYDYTMTVTGGDAYMASAGMTPGQVAAMHAMPIWAYAGWALGVWAAAIGSILLLVRSRYAVYAFTASLIGVILLLVETYLLSAAYRANGQMGMIMNAVITVVALLLLWFASSMAKRGVLR